MYASRLGVLPPPAGRDPSPAGDADAPPPLDAYARLRLFRRIGRDRREILLERLDRNLRQLAADVLRHARELFVREERQQRVTAAHLCRAVVEGADCPGFVEHRRNVRAHRRRASVAGLEMIEALRQLRRQPRPVDAVLLENRRDVAVGIVEQLHQIMLNLDVIVRARQAEARRGFHGAPSRVIQLADEGSEIDSHCNASSAMW